MSKQKRWIYDPHSGGVKIPEGLKEKIKLTIYEAAEKHFSGKYNSIGIKFRGQFCYIDKYIEPVISNGWPPSDWSETREQYYERLKKTPMHLCRLRFFREDEWSFAFFRYSNEKYEPSIFPNGNMIGTPEQALLACSVYFNT